MVVAIAVVEIEVPESASLKTKRRVVRSITAKVRNRYNVSIAEVGHLDSWQLATLEVACASSDAAYAHGLLEKVVKFIDTGPFDCVLLDYGTELL